MGICPCLKNFPHYFRLKEEPEPSPLSFGSFGLDAPSQSLCACRPKICTTMTILIGLFLCLLAISLSLWFFVVPRHNGGGGGGNGGGNNSFFKCPNQTAQFSVCRCDDTLFEIRCEGPNLTQSDLNSFFDGLRQFNKIPIDDWLTLNSLFVTKTNLTQLDLSHLSFLNVTQILNITGNQNLTTILVNGPKSDLENEEKGGKIETIFMDLSGNSLIDKGLENFFINFSPKMKKLWLNHNNISGQILDKFSKRGSAKNQKNNFNEILPNLSTLVELEELSLNFNKITTIAGSQFTNLSKLQSLSLTNNKISKIGPSAFHFNFPPDKDMTSVLLTIHLEGNKINNRGINHTHDLQSIGRPIDVKWMKNHFEILSETNFGPILARDVITTMDFSDNKFICDNRMQWLKDARSKLEPRVTGIDCVNDPGKTIFTTNLLSSAMTLDLAPKFGVFILVLLFFVR